MATRTSRPTGPAPSPTPTGTAAPGCGSNRWSAAPAVVDVPGSRRVGGVVGPPAAISARRITGNSAVTPKFPPGRKAAGAVQEAWKLELPPRRRSPRCRGVLLGLAVLPWYLVGSTAWVQEPPAAGCAAALVSEGQTIDGLPMERWTWAGAGQDLGTLDGHRVVLCEASGPRERLPFQNAIGCMLIDDQAARVGDRLACGAYLTVEWRPILCGRALHGVRRRSVAARGVLAAAGLCRPAPVVRRTGCLIPPALAVRPRSKMGGKWSRRYVSVHLPFEEPPRRSCPVSRDALQPRHHADALPALQGHRGPIAAPYPARMGERLRFAYSMKGG
jgi:hypothetical protein